MWVITGWYLDDMWVITGWYLDDMWVITGWYLDDMWVISGWYPDDMWVICGWYLDYMWVISGWYLGDFWMIFGWYLGNIWMMRCRVFIEFQSGVFACNSCVISGLKLDFSPSWGVVKSIDWMICRWYLDDMWVIFGWCLSLREYIPRLPNITYTRT